MLHPKVGSHISKSCPTIYESIMKAFDNNNYAKAVQMFLHNPRSGKKFNITDLDIAQTAEYIQTNNIHYYTHAPYIINLSNPYNNKAILNKELLPWTLQVVAEDLELTDTINGMGVVVHVGKSLKMSIPDALDVMYQSIQTILPKATASSPLLLETPAHQGTELCWTYDSLSEFYDRFTEDEKKVFKICVDTCHVFAAGEDPLEYLQKWSLSDVKLVHLNDSKCEKGCRKDRHAFIGTGCIGYQKLKMVIDYCVSNGIDMVIE